MRRTLVISLAALLAGCGVFGKEKEIKKPGPVPLPKVEQTIKASKVWSEGAGGGSKERGLGLVPALEGESIYAAGPNGQLTAFDVQTGRTRWRANLDTQISGAVGAGDGVVVVGTTEGQVIAVTSDEGKIAWSRKVPSEVLAPPIVRRGVVVVRSVDGTMTGLAAVDGERKWSLRRRVPSLSLRGSAAPVVSDKVAIAGFADGKIIAVDLESGVIRWEVRVAHPSGRNEVERMIDIDARPLLVGSVLYVASYQGRVLALALGSRRIAWARDLSSYGDLGADSQNIYISDEGGKVLALDRLTGSKLWTQDQLLRRQLTGPVVVGGVLAVGDYEGYMHFLNRKDGALLGRLRVSGGALHVTPLVNGDTLYASTEDGNLVAVRVAH